MFYLSEKVRRPWISGKVTRCDSNTPDRHESRFESSLPPYSARERPPLQRDVICSSTIRHAYANYGAVRRHYLSHNRPRIANRAPTLRVESPIIRFIGRSTSTFEWEPLLGILISGLRLGIGYFLSFERHRCSFDRCFTNNSSYFDQCCSQEWELLLVILISEFRLGIQPLLLSFETRNHCSFQELLLVILISGLRLGLFSSFERRRCCFQVSNLTSTFVIRA